jgi:hypothetical protein
LLGNGIGKHFHKNEKKLPNFSLDKTIILVSIYSVFKGQPVLISLADPTWSQIVFYLD